MWPNLAASALCTAVVWVKLHLEGKRSQARHDELTSAVAPTTAPDAPTHTADGSEQTR